MNNFVVQLWGNGSMTYKHITRKVINDYKVKIEEPTLTDSMVIDELCSDSNCNYQVINCSKKNIDTLFKLYTELMINRIMRGKK